MRAAINECDEWYDLTSPQYGVWLTQEVYYDTPIGNIGGTVYIHGNIDVETLRRAINHTIEIYDVLRTEIRLVENKPIQRIRAYEPYDIEYIDFREFEDGEQTLKSWIEYKNSEIIRLYEDKLYYFAILHIKENEYAYYIKYHHIIADGWSSELLINDIHNSYTQILQNGEVKKIEQPSYLEFYERDKRYRESGRFLKDREYWRNKLCSLEKDSGDRNDLMSTKGKRDSFYISEEMSEQIKRFAVDKKISINSLMIAAYLVYCYKTTKDKKIAVGCPIYNRKGSREKAMVGMFTNTIPFIMDVDGNLTCQEFIESVKREIGEFLRHYQYPMQTMKEENEIGDLYHVCVNFYNSSLKKEIGGMSVTNEEFYNGHQIYDLQIVIRNWADTNCLQLSFDYKVSRYDIHKITGMFQSLVQILKCLIEKEDLIIDKLDLLSDEYKDFMNKTINGTTSYYSREETIISLIDKVTKAHKDKVAIQYYERVVTFSQLDEYSNNLANYLAFRGIKKGQHVGIIMRNSDQLVITILAVLKLSAVYVPLNLGIPKERLEYIVSNSNMSAILVEDTSNCTMEFRNVINVRDYDKSLYSSEKQLDSSTDKSVYIIYTSGTTGNPKGVEINETNLLNYILWAKEAYKIENDVFALFTNISFDLTVTSLFLPLITGNKMVIYDAGREKDYLLHKIVEDKMCTFIKATPSHLKLLLDYEWGESCIHKIVIGGEQLTTSLAHGLCERLGKDVEIYNEYGPTEATVGCMIYQYQYSDSTSGAVSIGKPIHNCRIYIGNDKFEQVPMGEIGEMYIAGDGVAVGYVNNVELTSKNFIKHQFNEDVIYKTGDLARILVDGNMEYIGRKDKQVKWNGYRIELGEIEENLRQVSPIFSQCVVAMKKINGNESICSYFCSDKEIDCSLYKQQLMKKLPSYMIPAHFIAIPEIPLTSNGKVDEKNLPIPDICEVGEERVQGDSLYEILIASLKKVLGVESINPNDDFYALGGDSISAIALVSQLKSKGICIRVRDILSNSSIKNMALCMEPINHNQLEKKSSEDVMIRNLPIVHWFLEQDYQNKNLYCNIVTIKLNKKLDFQMIQNTLIQIVNKHAMLYAKFDVENECFVQFDKQQNQSEFLQFVESHQKNKLAMEELDEFDDMLMSKIDISSGNMVQAAVINCGIDQYIKICIHHLVIDAVSWRIILNEMFELLNQKDNALYTKSSDDFTQYMNWCEHLYNLSDSYGSEKDFWIRNSSLLLKPNLPQSFKEREDKKVIHKAELDLQDYIAKKKHRVNMITEEELFLFALVIAWAKTFQTTEVGIDLESHGREEGENIFDIGDVVGWFTTKYPVKFEVDDEELPSLVRKLKERKRSVPRSGLGYGILKYGHGIDLPNDSERISFNFIGNVEFRDKDQEVYCEQITYKLATSKENKLQNQMDVVVFKENDEFLTQVIYNSNRYQEKDVQELIKNYEDTMNRIKDLIQTKVNFDMVPSDFKTISLSLEQLDGLFIGT